MDSCYRDWSSGEGVKPGMLYYPFLFVLRGIIRTFFRTIEVVGTHHIPPKGPVIFVGNHPNSLVDPALIVVTCRRRVSFAAKDTLFQTPVLKWILAGFGAVPIFRKQDHASPMSNADTFKALLDVLKRNGAFGIFPEGISHSTSQLAPLKTGAARLAFEAMDAQIPVTIIPCGLTYRKRTRLRARVLVQFGAPVEIEYNANDTEEERIDAVRQLTSSIDLSLRALTVNAPDFETLRVLDGVRRLYVPTDQSVDVAERVAITQRFIDHYTKRQHQEDIVSLYRDVEVYLLRLKALYLKDSDVVEGLNWYRKLWRLLLYFTFILLWLPLALPGFILHGPILYMAVLLGEGLVDHKDRVATYKVVFSVVLHGIVASSICAVLFFVFPWPENIQWIFLTLVLYIVTARAVFEVLDRQWIIARGAFVLMTLVNMGKALKELTELRDALRQRVLVLADRYYREDEAPFLASTERPPE